MKNMDVFDRYLFNRMSAEEKSAFEERLKADSLLGQEFADHKKFVMLMQAFERQERLAMKMEKIYHEEFGESNTIAISSPRTFYARYGKTIGVAASVSILAILITLALLASGGYLIKKHENSISNLSREVQEIKSVQEGIIDGIMSVKPTRQIIHPNIEGTAFALNDKGYFITSLHIVKGADSIFVQDNDRNSYRARLIHSDNQLDIAVMKLELDSGKTLPQLPYSFRASNAEVGEKVFTLGFPGEEMVYNEGTLSSKNGGSDTSLYQISVPINPGNSGGPLFDENGNVIGIIKSKNYSAEATGFAVKSSYLIEILSDSKNQLPEHDLSIKVKSGSALRGMKRNEQIKKIATCIFTVKVFKSNS